MNIAKPFLTRAQSHPHLQALTSLQGSLSFGEMAQRVCSLASGLRDGLGLQPGARVMLWMENRIEFMELLFATWAAGLCAVPVNAKLHAREVSPIVLDSGASIIFTSVSLHAGLMEALSSLPDSRQVVVVDDDQYQALARTTPRACADVEPTDLAWLFYTSGTTGVPKGAMLSHRNLMAMSLQYYADIDHVQPGQTMFHAAALSHGSGLYALPHLFSGGHQVIEKGFETDAVFEALQRYPDVSMFAAPTMLSRLTRAAHGVKNCAGNLLTAYYGGGPMYVNDLLNTLDIFGPRLFQVYGQGESPMTITGLSKFDHQGNRDEAHLARLASCGTARTATEVKVVDAEGNSLPVGELGEIVTRGDTRMMGYWNNEKATSSTIKSGWLWTGDIGVLDEKGYLTLRDRSKDMIIRGGSNIYPREIEEVLLRHPDVIEVSVIGRANEDLGEEPVAFVVVKPGATVSEEALDAMCLDNMARFKRPRAYFMTDNLPKNNYGKILKTELRKQLLEGNQ